MEEEEENEKEFWKRFVGKYVSLVKEIGGRAFYYNGTIVKVMDDKIILNDRKLGNIPLPMQGLAIVGMVPE